MKKAKTVKNNKPDSPLVEVSLKVLGKTFTATGSTVSEALFNVQPIGVAKGMAILTITKGEDKRERILSPIQTFRLFNGGRIMREIAVKNISMLF